MSAFVIPAKLVLDLIGERESRTKALDSPVNLPVKPEEKFDGFPPVTEWLRLILFSSFFKIHKII